MALHACPALTQTGADKPERPVASALQILSLSPLPPCGLLACSLARGFSITQQEAPGLGGGGVGRSPRDQLRQEWHHGHGRCLVRGTVVGRARDVPETKRIRWFPCFSYKYPNSSFVI